jgi:predicted transposase YbfD/YdcC
MSKPILQKQSLPPLLKARLALPADIPAYDKLLDQLHYLGSSKVEFTKRLRYVVENSKGEWCALLDFGYAALKNTALDEHIGWQASEKKKRLKYVLNNTRFLILPWMKTRYRSLASRSLALVTKRVSSDWEHHHGHHILMLETFVDVSRQGTCYKAGNWLEVGETKGFGKRGGSYVYHGNKKRVFVFALHRKAKEILASRSFPHPLLIPEKHVMLDVSTINLDELEAIFLDVPDPRPKPEHGNTFAGSKLLLVAACAFLSGYTSYVGIGDYVKNLPEEAIAKFKFKKNSRRRPEESCIRKFMNRLDPTILQDRIYAWLDKIGHSKKVRHIALDGKAMRACTGDNDRAIMQVAAVDAETGITLAAKQVDSKSNEIPAVQEMLASLNLKNTLVSADAMHTQTLTAETILKGGGDYLFRVKDNQQNLLKDMIRLHQKDFSPCVLHDGQSSREDRDKDDSNCKSSLKY